MDVYENRFTVSLVYDGLGVARIESCAVPKTYSTRLVSFLPSSDGKMIIVGGERDITLWEIGTGRRVATLAGHGGWVRGLALSSDGRILASAANDGALKLWDLALRQEVITLPGQISPWTRKLAFAPDGNSIAALSAEEDRVVRFFHAPSFQEIERAEAGKKATNSPP
jgi:WD40 repeat protein